MKKPKQPRPPKLTDEERHKRFVEVGRLVGASENSADFDKAFMKLDIRHDATIKSRASASLKSERMK